MAKVGEDVKLVGTRELSAGLLAHGNLGWSRSEGDAQNTTLWNLALEKSLAHGIDLMAEVYGDDRHKPALGSGVRWTFREGWSVNASYAVQTETPRVKLWTVGLKWAF